MKIIRRKKKNLSTANEKRGLTMRSIRFARSVDDKINKTRAIKWRRTSGWKRGAIIAERQVRARTHAPIKPKYACN